jgi:hypothetical protein
MVNKDLIKLVHDPNFNRPLSELNKDYSKKGQIILITKIKNNETN